MDKTPGYIPQFLTGYNGPRSSTSRAFQMLVRGIGEAKSKYEEEKIIKEEYMVLKEKIGQPASSKQMREYLLRLIYCEMLGVDTSAFHIHAINFAQQRNLHDKRIGYLALSIFLHEKHSLTLLLINTLQRDLTSTNVLEVCYALAAVNKLISAEMVPTILQQVLALLDNKRDIIRKKAIMALHTIYKKNPSLVPDISQRAINALNDTDFSVSSAALHILYDLILVDPIPYKNLVQSFVALLNKIISGKLKQEFDFHKLPAPWTQIKLLRILSLLGAYDLQASQQMYEVLQKTLSTLNASTLISFAVAYECTRTIATIYPTEKLKKYVAKCVGLFLVSNINDIKYLGINAMTSLIDVDPSYAAEPSYQRIVINCLDDPDETLKRKTLDLLCRITNADNVESICDRLIKHLKNTVDVYFKTGLVARVSELAERYAPDNSWYILTMNEVLELGGELVREDVAHNIMRLIAEGNEDEEVEEDLRRFAVISYMDLLEKTVLPDILVQVMSWIIGEYSYTAPEIDQESLMEKLCDLLDRNYTDSSTKRWVVTSIGKLLSRMTDQIPSCATKVLEQLSTDEDVDVRQRSHEINVLAKELTTMKIVLPVDASCEDLQVDSGLSFLDDYITKAFKNGASPYKLELERKKERREVDREPSLKIAPYELPQRLKTSVVQPLSLPPHRNTKESLKGKVKLPKPPQQVDDINSSRPLIGIKGPWGPKGYTKSPGSSSGDSGSKSGSSSKSSGPEIPTVTKTIAESTPRSLVFAHEEKSKQVVDDIFKGVGNVSTKQPNKRSIRSISRMTRPVNQVNKLDIQGFDPGSAPKPPPRKYLEKDSQSDKREIDLLMDMGTDEATDKTTLDDIADDIADNEDHVRSSERLLPIDNSANPESTPSTVCEPHFWGPSDIDYGFEMSTKATEKDFDFGFPGKLKESDPSEELEMPVNSSNYNLSSKKSVSGNIIDAEIVESVASLTLEGSPSNLNVPEDLQDFPCSTNKLELCSDANLRVVLQTVYKPDELVLVIFLTNQSQASSPVTNLVTIIEPPSNLRGSFDSTDDNRFVDAVLEPLMSLTHRVTLKYKSPALHMTLSGKITYKDYTNTAKNLYISTVLPLRCLVRPLPIDTKAFGDNWNKTPFEKRKCIPCNSMKLDELVELMEERLGMKKVDIIDSKVIAVGSILQGPVCLLHGTLDADGMLDIRIKTNSELLSDALIKQCMDIFK